MKNTILLQDTIVISVDTTRSHQDQIPIITIKHNTLDSVSFTLSIDKKNWFEFYFTKIGEKLFDIGKFDKCYFIIKTTEEKKAKYLLYKSKSYTIEWNREENMWKLKEDE